MVCKIIMWLWSILLWAMLVFVTVASLADGLSIIATLFNCVTCGLIASLWTYVAVAFTKGSKK